MQCAGLDSTLLPIRFALHDRDSKFCASFQATLYSGAVQTLRLPARSPNLNAFAGGWVRSIKSECLSKVSLFGEASLRRTLAELLKHYHHERNHQGKENTLLFPAPGCAVCPPLHEQSRVRCHECLGGL